MTIFAIGMTGILALLQSTISLSFVSRHEIIAANILREQSELLKNIRNTNIRSFVDWDKARIDDESTSLTGWVYIVENDFSNSGIVFDVLGEIEKFPVLLKKIATLPSDLEGKFNATQLFLDTQWRYSHMLSGSGTSYASYVVITPLSLPGIGEIKKDNKNQWYVIDARVIVRSRGYKEYDLKTLITDWKK